MIQERAILAITSLAAIPVILAGVGYMARRIDNRRRLDHSEQIQLINSLYRARLADLAWQIDHQPPVKIDIPRRAN